MKLLIFFILLFNIVLFGQGKDNNIVLKAEDERTGEIENIKRKIDGSLQIFSTNTASNPVYISYPEHYHDSSQIINIPATEVLYGSNIGTITSNANVTINGGTLTADTVEFDDGYMTSILCNIIKVHQTDTITPITSTWTPFTWSDTIADETQGNIFSLISDSTIQLNDTGIYMFGGCVHIRNTSGANVDATIGSRIFAASTETRCSQRLWADNLKNNGEITLSYNGTVYISYGDTVQLQYYSTTSDIDFIGNPIFNSQVAATLWMKKGDVGEAK